MRLEPIDSTNRLWEISDVIDESLLQKILEYDWNMAPGGPGVAMSDYRRLALELERIPLLQQLDTQLRYAINEVSRQTNLDFSHFYTDYWLDQPGWTVPLHTDAAIKSSLQMYWVGESGTGTSFYHSRDTQDLRYQFEFRPNTGYLMLNMVEDGVQPLQWHAMLHPITKPRLSSYTRLGPYYQR